MFSDKTLRLWICLGTPSVKITATPVPLTFLPLVADVRLGSGKTVL